MTETDDIETIRDALRVFAYQPGEPVFSRYESAIAALARLEERLAAALSTEDNGRHGA